VPAGRAVSAEPVRRGDIRQTLSYSGDVRARDQISVLPKASGRIQQLLVDTGSDVTTGDTLAILDQTNAQLTVAQANAALSVAQARLDTLAAGPRSEDVAAARAALDQQQTKLQNMRAGGRIEDIRAAEAGLSAAQARLEAVQNGADEDVRQAQRSAIASDTAAVSSAEAAYAALGGQNAANLQAAQSQVDSLQAQIATAQAMINSADAVLTNVAGSSAADVRAAQSAYDQAQAQLRTAQAALKQAFQPTQAAIAQAEAAVESARSQRAQAEAQQTALEHKTYGTVCSDVPVAHNSTACGDAKAAADVAITAANAAVEAAQGQLDLLRRGGAPALQVQLQAAVDQAQAQSAAAKARLEAIENGGVAATRAQAEAQKQQAQGLLVQAQQSLAAAQATLDAAQHGNLDAQVKNASAQLTAARERLKADQARLGVIERGPTDQDIQQAADAVERAQQQLNKARAPYTSYDLRQQEQAVQQATAQLQKVSRPFTDQDFEAAQAAVDQAQAAANLAYLALDDTVVTAPVDGVIADRLVAAGALVSPQTPIVTLVPPSLELVVNVDESHLAQVALGQSVQLTVPAFPDQTFTGTVSSIAPTIDPKSRTATVHIQTGDASSQLRGGMFATLNIITADRHDTLLVPRQSLIGGAVLTITSSGAVHRQPVKIGIQDDKSIEILSGIDDGQLIATSGVSDLTEGEIVAPQIQAPMALASQ
jgi:HlyD family secretion protein